MKKDQLDEVIQKLCHDSGFDKEMAVFVIETYLKQTQEILTAAFETIRHMESDSYLKLEALMHKLKGSSGNVRAMRIMELSIEAENFAKEKKIMDLEHKLSEVVEIIDAYNAQLIGGI